MTSPTFTYVHTPSVQERLHYEVQSELADAFIQRLVASGHTPAENKLGDAIIAATFVPGTRLEQANLTAVTALILDIDGGRRKNGVFIPDCTPLEWFIDRLPYKGVAHTSYSHTPEKPKFRLIFPLEKPITVEEHHRLWSWVHRQVEEKPDPSCKNPDRLFFMPRATPASIAAGWPWTRPLEGTWLSMDAVPESFHLADSQAVSAPPEAAGALVGPPAVLDGDTRALLDVFENLPITVWALNSPEAVSREVWRGLAQNLAAMLNEQPNVPVDANLVDALRHTFHTISKADPRRYEYRNTERVFQGARKSVMQLRGPMSYAHMQLNGAPPEAIPADGTVNPILHARRLLRQKQAAEYYAQRATVTPPTGQPALSPTPSATAPPPAPPVAAEPPSDGDGAPPLNLGAWSTQDEDRFFYDEQAQGFRYLRDPANPRSLSPSLSNQTMLQILCFEFGMPAKAARRLTESFKILSEYVLDPALAPGPVVQGRRYVYNAYAPSSITPVSGNWDNLRKLLEILTGNDPKAYEYFIDWLASPLQALYKHKKTDKLRTAVALSGAPGAGKGTLEYVLKLLYGEEYVATVGQEILDSPYQGALINRLFVVADECKSHDRASTERLKRLITSHKIDIEEKYERRTTYPNVANYLFTTNDDRPVRVEKGDRRFSVFYTAAPDRAVTDAVWADIHGPRTEVAAFFDFLLNRSITHDINVPCHTEAREFVQQLSLTPVQSFVLAVKEFGLMEAAAPWMQNHPMRHPAIEDGSTDVASHTLLAIFRSWASANGYRGGGSDRAVLTGFTKEGLVPPAVVRRVNGVCTRVYTGIPFDPAVKPE